MGRPIDRSSWPTTGPHLELLKLLDRVHRENGMRSQRAIAQRMNLSSPSRVNAMLRGLSCPSDDDQVRALVHALGGSSEDQDQAVVRYQKIIAVPPNRGRNRSVAATRVGRSPDLTLRVWPAASAIAYIKRDVEKAVSSLLNERRPVVLVGSSMVGKTRIAASVIEAKFTGRKLYTPDSREELRVLAESSPRDGVLFLDDIDRLIGGVSVTQRQIRALSQSNALVATIRSHLYDIYQLPVNRCRAPEWDVLSEFEPVVVSSDLSAAEQVRLRTAVRDDTERERILATGIGEYVGAAEVIKRTLAVAPTHQPVAMALLAGAADWARAGLRRPAPTGLLAELATPHLSRREAGLLPGSGFDDAMAWAMREINPRVSLLQPADYGFEINEYALDVLSESDVAVPGTTWRMLLDVATPEDMIDISLAAARAERPDVAEEALRLCEQANDPATWPLAAMLLGPYLRERGDTAAAQAAYRRAIDSSHPVAAPSAWFNLGNLHVSEGRLTEAQEAYREAAESGYPAVAHRALLALGGLFDRCDRPADAEAAYRRVVAMDLDLDEFQHNVERSFQERGVPVVVATIDARRHRPDPEITAPALLKLGRILGDRGERHEARRLLERAAHIDGSPVVADALHALGDLLAADGELRAAVDTYERALSVADAHTAPKTECNLGAVLMNLREYDRAETMLCSAIRSQHEEASVVAGLYLAVLLTRCDRRSEAEATLADVVTYGDTPSGRSALGKILLLDGAPGVTPALPHLARNLLRFLESEITHTTPTQNSDELTDQHTEPPDSNAPPGSNVEDR